MERHDCLWAGQGIWDAVQAERVNRSSVFSSFSEGPRVAFRDGVRIEAVPGCQEGSVRIVGGPLATVGTGAMTSARAFLSFLNAFYIKDGIFYEDDMHHVYLEVETSDQFEEDGGVKRATRVVASSAGTLASTIEAVCTGRLSLDDAVRHLANRRATPIRAELGELMESLMDGGLHRENIPRRSLFDEVRKTSRQEVLGVVESEGGGAEGMVEIHGAFRPFRVESIANGSRAKILLTLFPGLIETERAPGFALKVAELAGGDVGWSRVAVDPRDGECVYVAQVLTDVLEPTITQALEWGLAHGIECEDLAWSLNPEEDAGEGARRRLIELLDGAPMTSGRSG